MLMLLTLAAAATLFALGAIVADWNERRPPVFKVLKPLTTILIIGIALAAPESGYRNWVTAALVLSLAGDICLMFESDRAFIGGLSSFLLAHLAFIAAFLQGLQVHQLPAWIGLVLLLGLGYFVWLLPRTGKMKLPVLVYGLVLFGMALTAAMRWQAWGNTGSALALAGALVFIVSDSSLAFRRFVRRYAGAQALILSTYWSAIGLIAASTHLL
ncbi:MAG TPA: lysoplasmalogenase [Solimonas sp.]|nr:lysoplasmalogenase [Solimonas sp.]